MNAWCKCRGWKLVWTNVHCFDYQVKVIIQLEKIIKYNICTRD
jgi:hypothetical protein